jgi:predicted glutamine amidotransferase
VFLERLERRWGTGRLDELAEILRELLSDPALVGEYTAANLLLLRGDDLFAFRRSRKDPEYYSLFRKEEEGMVTVASERLDEGDWSLFREGELVEISAPGLPGRVLDLP